MFKPSSEGEHSGKLTFTSNAPDRNIYEVLIRGEGIMTPEPDAEITPTAVSFGYADIGATVERTITLENYGPGNLTVESVVANDPQFVAVVPETPYELGAERQTITVSFTPGSAGAKASTLTVTCNDPTHPTIQVALAGSGAVAGGPAPQINLGGVVDAARYFALVAPGGIASLFGVDLAGAVELATETPLPTVLADVQVLVKGVPAPLFFVSASQINFQIPYEVTLGTLLQIVVVRNGVESPPVNVQVAEYAPAIFTNPHTGDPIVQRHPDYSVITSENPAKAGDVLIVYLTGVGGLSDPPATGAPALASPLSQSLVAPTATLAGQDLTVYSAALTPTFVGLAQVALQLPTSLPTAGASGIRLADASTLPLVVRFGDAVSQEVNLPVAVGMSP